MSWLRRGHRTCCSARSRSRCRPGPAAGSGRDDGPPEALGGPDPDHEVLRSQPAEVDEPHGDRDRVGAVLGDRTLEVDGGLASRRSARCPRRDRSATRPRSCRRGWRGRPDRQVPPGPVGRGASRRGARRRRDRGTWTRGCLPMDGWSADRLASTVLDARGRPAGAKVLSPEGPPAPVAARRRAPASRTRRASPTRSPGAAASAGPARPAKSSSAPSGTWWVRPIRRASSGRRLPASQYGGVSSSWSSASSYASLMRPR